MVLISHKYKFIYIKNVKTASSSVKNFFAKYCCPPGTILESNCNPFIFNDIYTKYGLLGGGSKININHNIFKGKHAEHIGITEIKKKFPLEFKNYFKFCVVRNPFERIVSRFLWDKHINAISKETKFKDYIKELSKNEVNKMNDDWYHRITINGKPYCQYYIKFDSLKKDIELICKCLNIKDFNINNLKHINKILDYNYIDFYDDESKQIVYDNCINEINYFNYKFK